MNMFSSLKTKIKEETGSDVVQSRQTTHNNNRLRHRLSTFSLSDDGEQTIVAASASDQLSLRIENNKLNNKISELTEKLSTWQEEKTRIEKTNEILLETVKVAQTQKDLYCEEQEKIQNLQQSEIEKLKNLLSFRDQEAVDYLSANRQSQQQIERLTNELERLKQYEPLVESLQDEVERLRHSAQLDKNNLTSTLAAVEEENRHFKMRLQIVDQARLDSLVSMKNDEKLQALVVERKLLEQNLEEAHLQLSDIKSSWCGQNLALETQVSRLSKQVAEETSEKRKAVVARDAAVEKIKQLEFEIENLKEELQHRDNKITLLEEEMNELNASLKECREDNEHQILFERNKSDTMKRECEDLKTRLVTSDERTNELEERLTNLSNKLKQTMDDNKAAVLKNADLSRCEEILKTDLKRQMNENIEINAKYLSLHHAQQNMQKKIESCESKLQEMENIRARNKEQLEEIEHMRSEIVEKTKQVKALNQHVADLQKTLQQEIREQPSGNVLDKMTRNGHITSFVPIKSICSNCSAAGAPTNPGFIVMDDVNFKYLKHVIVKFLTSREAEARHLIKAVATLLKLSEEEEKLLHDTLDWRSSWFSLKT